MIDKINKSIERVLESEKVSFQLDFQRIIKDFRIRDKIAKLSEEKKDKFKSLNESWNDKVKNMHFKQEKSNRNRQRKIKKKQESKISKSNSKDSKQQKNLDFFDRNIKKQKYLEYQNIDEDQRILLDHKIKKKIEKISNLNKNHLSEVRSKMSLKISKSMDKLQIFKEKSDKEKQDKIIDMMNQSINQFQEKYIKNKLNDNILKLREKQHRNFSQIKISQEIEKKMIKFEKKHKKFDEVFHQKKNERNKYLMEKSEEYNDKLKKFSELKENIAEEEYLKRIQLLTKQMSKLNMRNEQQIFLENQKMKKFENFMHDQIISERKIVQLNTKIAKIHENNLFMKDIDSQKQEYNKILKKEHEKMLKQKENKSNK